MPRKSKKDKIIADLRRRVRTEQTLTTHIPTLVKEDVAPMFRFQVKKETDAPPQQQVVRQNPTELTAIKRDLSKTFILATLAIAAEVIIYLFKR
jgi:hypothetical protein